MFSNGGRILYWQSGQVNILPLFTDIEKNNCFSKYTRSDLKMDEKETIEDRFNWPLNSYVEASAKLFSESSNMVYLVTSDKIVVVTVRQNGI